ncbi:MAG: hypothetical protein ACQZ3N_02460 [cyanobacterium endosymbiont of Rhopalodia yunnanensis]
MAIINKGKNILYLARKE